MTGRLIMKSKVLQRGRILVKLLLVPDQALLKKKKKPLFHLFLCIPICGKNNIHNLLKENIHLNYNEIAVICTLLHHLKFQGRQPRFQIVVVSPS